MGRVVGIDLGTTNSVVAVMEGGKPLVIANSEGNRTTPSVVGFNKDGELLVGQMARRQSVLNPQNTYYGVKRFIGRRYAELNAESKQVPYTIRRTEEDAIKIRCPRLRQEFAPEEIAAKIIRRLADEAERYLGEEVTGAVITVPAYFNDSQRQATRDAGRIAGLEVLRILNEPTAAALAYGLEQKQSSSILVFDLGGGTFDVSVLEVGDGVFEVKSTSGDTQLGGNDFDRMIVNWLAEKFLEDEGIDLRKDRQSLQRLTEAAEKAKIELSGVTTTEINLPFITATEDGPKHLETQLDRATFESLSGELVSRLRRPIKRALQDAGISPVQIREVVLVGGSTRIPMVQGLVRSFIDREPNQNVNPDEVVSVGAAIQAGILGGQVKDILLLDVTPLSLGLETIGGVMKKLIPRNTTIPVRRSDIFSTGENNQTVVEIHVMQGEREMAQGNKSLGRFKLTGIPPAPRGVPQVQVSFDIDANGILQVAARDKTTGREQSITVQGSSTLTDAEVNRMMQDAEKFAQEDRERREKVEKRNRAKALTDQASRRLKEVTLDFGSQFASYYRRRIESLSQEIIESLKKNDDRRLDSAQADLQDALYELNREVRMQYDDDDDSFFDTIKKTFIGDDEDDDYYYDARQSSRPGTGYGAGRGDAGRRDGYGRDYGYDAPRQPQRDRGYEYDRRSPQRQPAQPRQDYNYGAAQPRQNYSGNQPSQPSGNDRYSNGNGSTPRRRPSQPPRPDDRRRSNGRDPYEQRNVSRKYYSQGQGRNIPYENDWDEDDEWF